MSFIQISVLNLEALYVKFKCTLFNFCITYNNKKL